ncbi:MAG: hypothetical protein H7225_17185 [Massilia sp.]|nr:hypothetical protein [Aquabacterium sp.]
MADGAHARQPSRPRHRADRHQAHASVTSGAIHPFSIGILERDQWLACMFQAMQEVEVDPVLAERLEKSFFQTADWMRNQGV